MGSSADIMKQFQKDLGENAVKAGNSNYVDTIRLPTGVFAFDLATGGGFPMGRVSIVFGVESSNKTNIVLKAIGNGQRMYPDKKAVFIDAENAYDPLWAAKMGVDTANLIVCNPEYAEQAVDMIQAFLYAEDVFAVVLDSIAALTTENEITSSAEKASVGGASLHIGKLFRKTVISFTSMRNQGLMPPAFIAVNQIRHKIGVMFGDPETMPGGNAPRFASSLTVRIYGKNEIDKKIHPVLPAFKKTSIIVRKWKVPILAVTGEFMMQMIDGAGRPAGYVEDWNTVSNYLKDLDYLSKGEKNKGWILFGEVYKTLEDCRGALYSDPATLQEVKDTIIKELLSLQTVDSIGGDLVEEPVSEEDL